MQPVARARRPPPLPPCTPGRAASGQRPRVISPPDAGPGELDRPTLELLPVIEPGGEGRLREELVQARAVLASQQQTISDLGERVIALENQLAVAAEALERRDEAAPARPAPPPPVAVEPRTPAAAPDESLSLRCISAALHPDTIPVPSRRKAPRIPCELEVEFSQETELYAGITADLSQGGLFIATYHPYPLGTRLDVGFELPDGTAVKACGTVRWLRAEAAGVSRPGMGVAFERLSEEALAAIVAFCRQRAPLYMEL